MLQVCDGKILWDYNQVLDSQQYRKIDIAAVRKKLADPVLDDAIRDRVLAQIGFTGPEALLVGLRQSVKFNQKADGELDGHKVWIVRGSWKSIQGLMQGQQPLPPTAPLPPYIPSNIALTIDQATGWPYKVEMVGNLPSLLQEDSRRIGLDGRPVGAKVTAPKVDPSRMTLTYSKRQDQPRPQARTVRLPGPPRGQGAHRQHRRTAQLPRPGDPGRDRPQAGRGGEGRTPHRLDRHPQVDRPRRGRPPDREGCRAATLAEVTARAEATRIREVGRPHLDESSA